MKALAAAYVLGLVPALVLGVFQPMWSRVDEPAHYDVIAQYAAGVYPHDSVTTIRPQTLEVMQRTGVYGFIVDAAYAEPDLSGGFQSIPPGISAPAHVLWIRRHGFEFSYEAFQPPLYYAIATPFWMLGNAVGGALGAVYAVRILDALLAALLAPLALLISLRLWPANPSVAWGAAVLTAFMPGVALNLTAITNDVLASVLGGACILIAISGSWTRKRVLILGLLFGGALLTKTTTAAIAPALAVALMQRDRGGGWKPLTTTGLVAALCLTPWLISNLAIYGELITTREQLAMAAFPPRTADPAFWTVSTLHAFVTFWAGDPFLSLPGAVAITLMAALVTALSIAGAVHTWRRGLPGLSRNAVAVVALAAAGAAFVSITTPVLAAFNAPGRFAYVALPAVTALVTAGLWVELRSARLRRAVLGTFATVSVVGLALLDFTPAATYVNAGVPRIAHEHPLGVRQSFGPLTVGALTCAVDVSGDSWLLVRMTNTGDTPVEWSQSVDVYSGSTHVTTSDYRRSTPFPDILKPGFSYSGWLWLGPSARLQRLNTTRVVLKNVATDGYKTVGDLEILTALC
jgi:hypothetical protein